MNKQVLEYLRKIFTEHFMLHLHRFNHRQSLSKDLRLNQYEMNEVLLYLENEYHINIEDKEISHLQTVGDLVQCIERHRR